MLRRKDNGQLLACAGEVDERDPARGEARRLRGGLRRDEAQRRNAAPDGLVSPLAGHDGRALQRHALGQEHGIADLGAARGHELVLVHLTQHRADHDGARQAPRHLGMTAHQRNPYRRARLGQLGEELLHLGFLTPAFGQEHGSHEPPRSGATHGQVVGIDVQCVPAHLVGGEGNGIGGGDEVTIAHVQHGGILAHLRPDHHAWISRDVLAEEALEELGGQLAHGQRRHGPRSI